jgi:hypothetical protein
MRSKKYFPIVIFKFELLNIISTLKKLKASTPIMCRLISLKKSKELDGFDDALGFLLFSAATGSKSMNEYDKFVKSRGRVRDSQSVAELLIEELPPASVLCAWQIEIVRGRVDLFVNFISFQEMEPPIVQNYLAHVSRLNARWVLLRNLREGKQKRGHPDHWVGVETPILGDDYLDMLPEYELVERNVHPFGYRTVDGFHSELLLLRRKS